MAKDPAFLFYPGDYVSGTMHLDFECKGAYMDLLMLQFQKDHMTSHMIKQVLGHRYEHIWPLISDKFQEKGGKIWNERLRIEKEKRTKFCKSRQINRNSKKDMSEHMIPHMENENENENVFEERREGVGEKKEGFPGFPLPGSLNGLPEIKVGAVIELIHITKQKKVTNADVLGMWEVFKVQNLTGKKFYQDVGAVHSHFINWIKMQDFQKKGLPKGNNDPMEEDARKILKAVNKK